MQATDHLLSNISSIRTGYTFREKVENKAMGEIAVIQPKDIIDKNTISKEITKVEDWEITPIQNHLLKNGDLLIANKGLRFSIFLYSGFPASCIASSSFFVISVNQNKVLPEYLAWFLEQEPAKTHLISKASGSIIPSINKSTIQQLQVPLPSLATQKYIVELLELAAKQLNKLMQLHERKKEYYNSHIWEKVIGDLV